MAGDIVLVEDVAALLQAVGVATLPDVTPDALATRLNGLATDFVLALRVFDTATFGDQAKFLRSWARRITAALEPLGADPPPSLAAERLAYLLRGDKVGPTDVPLVPDSLDRLRRWDSDTRSLRDRVELLAGVCEIQQGGPRQASGLELALFQQLAQIFEESFGRRMTGSLGGEAQQGGPGVRFCLEIVKLMKQRSPLSSPGVGDPLPAVLARLSHPGAVRDCIRSAMGGQPRKR